MRAEAKGGAAWTVGFNPDVAAPADASIASAPRRGGWSAPLGMDTSGGLNLTGPGLSEEEGPCPDTADTASSSSARSSPSTRPGSRRTCSAGRHDLSRNLIRIWVEKAGAGQLDRDQEAADLLGAYEAKIAALERLVGQQALEITFLKKAQKTARSRTSAASSATTGPTGSPSNGGAR